MSPTLPIRKRVIVLFVLIIRVVIHKGTLFALLLVDELIVDAVVQIGIVVLLVDSILLSAFSAEFDYASWSDKLSDLFGPFKRRVIFLDFLDLIASVNEHRFDGVEGRQDK